MNVDELRVKVASLPVLQEEGCSASLRTWHEHTNEIRRLILEDDPERFLTWSPIVSTMATLGHEDWSATEREFLESLLDWNARWQYAVEEPAFGSPLLRCFDPESNSATLNCAFCLARFEQEMKLKVSSLNLVFEFGGGYGCMARLFRKLDFGGLYLDYDFPVIAALAQYYLSEIGYLTEENEHAFFLSNLSEVRVFLNRLVPAGSLFLSTWALSEAPLDTRLEVLSLVDKLQYFYVVYQPGFYEVDNDRFFATVPEMLQSWQWKRWAIEHLGAMALAGVRT